MRYRIYNYICLPVVIIITILISAALTYFFGGIGYIFGMTIALILLWASRFKWTDFGINKPNWLRTILTALQLAISFFVIVDIIIQPVVEFKFGITDLSSLDGIRGNFFNYILFMLIMWLVAGFGEEFLFRGFFMKHLARAFGDTNKAWLISALSISMLFGLAHKYQGVSGMITTGTIGLLLSLIFYRRRNNLVLLMFIHGFYDMIGITLIYLNRERFIIDWIQTNLFN